jgi:hypothetical protein
MVSPTVSELSKIEWSRSYLWNIMFTDTRMISNNSTSTVGNTVGINTFSTYNGNSTSTFNNPIVISSKIDSSTTTPTTPFNQWFPATDYNDTKLTGSSAALGFYLRQYKFPIAASVNDITLTFPDDVYGTLYLWLKKWYNYIYDDTAGIACIYDCAKQLKVQKLGPDKKPLTNISTGLPMVYTYYVYPESTVPEIYSSDSNVKTYSVTFAVVGQDDPDSPITST